MLPSFGGTRRRVRNTPHKQATVHAVKDGVLTRPVFGDITNTNRGATPNHKPKVSTKDLTKPIKEEIDLEVSHGEATFSFDTGIDVQKLASYHRNLAFHPCVIVEKSAEELEDLDLLSYTEDEQESLDIDIEEFSEIEDIEILMDEADYSFDNL